MKRTTFTAGSITLAALIFTLAACAPGGGPNTAATDQTVAVERGNIALAVSGNGTVKPARDIDMNFGTTGTIAEVLVEEGQQVKRGDVLARLVTVSLDQQITQAEANLKSAQAELADLKDGPSATDLRDAEAQLSSAQAQLSQQANGNALPSQISNAQAQLRSAQAELAALKNPTEADLSKARLTVSQAENSLAVTRASAAKTKAVAQLDLDSAANTLRNAQDSLSTTFWNTHNADGTFKKAADESGYQNDVDTYNKALRSEQDAANGVATAQLTYDNAVTQEQLDIADATATLANAQAQLDALVKPSAKDLAAAQAKVASAVSSLNQLTTGTGSDIAVAQSTVEQRQSAIDALTADPTTTKLAAAEATIAQAEASLGQAKLDRANAELIAPFDGIVAAVNVKAGQSSNSASPVIYLIDNSSFHVDVQISESDLGKIKLDQAAAVDIDALQGQTLQGKVSYIAPNATADQDVTTYLTRVLLDDTTQPLRAGLSAAVDLVGASAENVLIVPSSAIVQTDSGPQVYKQNGEGPSILVPVAIGLVGDTYTEVTSGVNEGDMVLLGS